MQKIEIILPLLGIVVSIVIGIIQINQSKKQKNLSIKQLAIAEEIKQIKMNISNISNSLTVSPQSIGIIGNTFEKDCNNNHLSI